MDNFGILFTFVNILFPPQQSEAIEIITASANAHGQVWNTVDAYEVTGSGTWIQHGNAPHTDTIPFDLLIQANPSTESFRFVAPHNHPSSKLPTVKVFKNKKCYTLSSAGFLASHENDNPREMTRFSIHLPHLFLHHIISSRYFNIIKLEKSSDLYRITIRSYLSDIILMIDVKTFYLVCVITASQNHGREIIEERKWSHFVAFESGVFPTRVKITIDNHVVETYKQEVKRIPNVPRYWTPEPVVGVLPKKRH
jgi:hypothetical protein